MVPRSAMSFTGWRRRTWVTLRRILVLAAVGVLGMFQVGSSCPARTCSSAVALRTLDASRPFVPATTASGHLYVGDLDAVYEFRLDGGLPESAPDRILTSLKTAQAITVSPSGELFGFGEYRIGSKIVVFAPGASGSANAVRRIDPPTEINGLAVDASGYTYASAWEGNTYIFTPTAHLRHGLVRTISSPQASYVGLDQHGNLYLQNPGIETVLSNPISMPTQIRQFCWKAEQILENGLAVGPDGTVFIGLAATRVRPGRVLVYGPKANGCPTHLLRLITPVGTPMYNVLAVALSGDRLYALDERNPSLGGPAVFVFDSRKGAQVPEAILYGPSTMLRQPLTIALGP